MLATSGEEANAINTLAGALTLACPQGYVRVFADEGPPMAALLARLIATQRVGQATSAVPLGCLARLQRAFDAERAVPNPGRGAAALPGLVEPLTSRELEVLGMLAAGRSNQAISGQLVVPSTLSRSTSATSWASSAQPTAPRPSPGHGNWA